MTSSRFSEVKIQYFVRILRIVLIDNLQKIIVDILLVNQRDVLACAVITFQDFDSIFLKGFCFLNNALIGICDIFRKKAFSFAVCKGVAVEPFNLFAEVDNQIFLFMDSQILIAQFPQTADKFLFQFRFTLIVVSGSGIYSVTTVFSFVSATMLK